MTTKTYENMTVTVICKENEDLEMGVDNMVTNLICDVCKFQPKCVGYNKLKPFIEEARTDLGIELEMQKCNDFVDMNDNDEDAG